MATEMTQMNFLRRYPALKTYLANPVVIRDLRAQMRGTKSYWYQGGFLLLLGILALVGYAQATGQSLTSGDGSAIHISNIAEAQGRLESFYWLIFLTLAGLTALIAPALTASSVVGERQRLSFDLLVTTPLSASQLLIGKLISSTAFLVLLLALSLPASALCVLLGGATIADLFRMYFMLAVDGLVLAAIGLYFSCAVRVPLLATVWTYGSVIVYLAITGILYVVGPNLSSVSGDVPLLRILSALNPLVAMTHGFEVSIPMGATTFVLPLWPLTAVVAATTIRLLLTASEYRLGIYGGSSLRSLRRQALVGLGVVTFAFAHDGRVNSTYNGGIADGGGIQLIVLGMIYAFLACLPFLIALFVPAAPEDAPPGTTSADSGGGTDGGIYRWRKAFTADHAGSLPFFHLALAVGTGAMILGLATRESGIGVIPEVLLGSVYLAALGFLVWSIARRVFRSVKGLSSARAVTFGVFTALVALPMMVLAFTTSNWADHPIAFLWILRPLAVSRNGIALVEAAFTSGVVAMLLGGGIMLSERAAARKAR